MTGDTYNKEDIHKEINFWVKFFQRKISKMLGTLSFPIK